MASVMQVGDLVSELIANVFGILEVTALDIFRIFRMILFRIRFSPLCALIPFHENLRPTDSS